MASVLASSSSLPMAPSPSGLPAIGQTPISSAFAASTTDPSQPISLGLALAPNGSLSLSTTAQGDVQTAPSQPVGPRAIVTVLASSSILRDHWPATQALLTAVQQRAEKLHDSQFTGSGILYQGVTYSHRADLPPSSSSPLESLFGQQPQRTRTLGPLLPRAFNLLAKGHLGGRDDYYYSGSLPGWDEGEVQRASIDEAIELLADVSSSRFAPSDTTNVGSDDVCFLSLGLQLLSRPTGEQAPGIVRSIHLPPPPEVLGHYLVHVVSADDDTTSASSSQSSTAVASAQLKGVVTALLPSSNDPLQATPATSSSSALHEQLARNIGPSLTFEDAGTLFTPSSNEKSSKGEQPSPTKSTPSSDSPGNTAASLDAEIASQLKGVKVMLAGFNPASRPSKRRREDETSAAEPTADKKQKVDATSVKPEQLPSSAAAASTSTSSSRPPPIWSGNLAWALDNGTGVKRPIKIWINAMLMTAAAHQAGRLLLPWPDSLNLTLRELSSRYMKSEVLHQADIKHFLSY